MSFNQCPNMSFNQCPNMSSNQCPNMSFNQCPNMSFNQCPNMCLRYLSKTFLFKSYVRGQKIDFMIKIKVRNDNLK